MQNRIMMFLLLAGLLTSLLLLAKVGCTSHQLQVANEQLNEELMTANLKLGRAQTEFGNAEKYIVELENAIQDEITQRNATLTMYGDLKARYEILEKKKQATKTEVVFIPQEIPVPVELGLIAGMYYQAVTSTLLNPLDYASGEYSDDRLALKATFKPRPNENAWTFDYHLKLDIEVQLAETYLPSGGVNHYASVWELDRKGNRIRKLDITSFKVVIEKPNESQWFWWAPHVDIGGMAGLQLPIPDILLGGSIGFSPFGYGLTVNDLDWRFLRVSLDLTNKIPAPGLTPALYNIGKWIPLFSNIWIGPHLTYLPPEGWGISLFLGAVL